MLYIMEFLSMTTLCSRSSWGSDLSCVFFLIGAVNDEDMRTSVQSEDYQFGDILHFPGIDSYRNLTLKVG